MPRVDPFANQFAGAAANRTASAAANTTAALQGQEDGTLFDLGDFGSNPGNLRMLAFLPETLPRHAPLVVVLHGCTQNAARYDQGAGWSTLAAAHGFALLYPEQVRANNAQTCFNWFEAGDTRRGEGEAASIAAAVAAMIDRHDLDPARVFVTGLSAGGAMAGAMLATYPDVFAGGAIIAGLPYGVARGLPQALSAMAAPAAATGVRLGDHVRLASGHDGPWPRVSIWHGGADRTVSARNGEAIAAQWRDVHGLADAVPSESSDGRHGLSVWHNDGGVPVVELNRIDGMAHGTPLEAGSDGSAAGPFMLDVGIGSSARIAEFWGLTEAPAPRPAQRTSPSKPAPHNPAPTAPTPQGFDIGKAIADAMRSAWRFN